MDCTRIDGNRIYIRRLEPEDAEALWELRVRNREFYRPFEPIRDDSHFTLKAQQEEIENRLREWANDQSYIFGVLLADEDRIIGRLSLTSVFRGPWQNCNMGYYMDERENGKGYMTEAVKLALRFAFEQAELHRVQAAVMPRNTASIRVLEKAGFRHEGLAKRYLQINGVWEDHNIYAITREEWKA